MPSDQTNHISKTVNITPVTIFIPPDIIYIAAQNAFTIVWYDDVYLFLMLTLFYSLIFALFIRLSSEIKFAPIWTQNQCIYIGN